MVAARLRRAPGKIAIDEAVVAGGSFGRGLLENLLVQRRQRAGRIGIAGITRKRKRLAAAAAEVDLPELAAFARLGHPAGAAVAVEGFGMLPDPCDRMIAAPRQKFEPGNGLGGMARQNLPPGRSIANLTPPATPHF